MDTAEQRISRDLHIDVENYAAYADGFSFTVATELQAYKAAYQYQGPAIQRATVRYASGVNRWLVQVYKSN